MTMTELYEALAHARQVVSAIERAIESSTSTHPAEDTEWRNAGANGNYE